MHWKTKSHRRRNNRGWVWRNQRGSYISHTAVTFLQHYNNGQPKRILYIGQCIKWTKSQSSIELFWVISLDGTIYLKLQFGNVNGKAIAIFVCFPLYFYLIANKSTIVFIVFVWWNHGTYFSQLSFICLMNAVLGLLQYIRRVYVVRWFSLPYHLANIFYLAILMKVFVW